MTWSSCVACPWSRSVVLLARVGSAFVFPMALDGVYYRMDDNDATVYFNNRMRISIAGSTITFQRKQQRPVRLTSRCIDAVTFAVEWFPVNVRWGVGIFRRHEENRVIGLLENEKHFWRYENAVVPESDEQQEARRSRSPRSLVRVRSDHTDMPLLHARRGNIAKVMYINLARRTDRRVLILNELQTLGIPWERISRIEAIDAEHEMESPLECCARSHIAALDQALSEDLEAVLILEDDFQLIHSGRETRQRWVQFLETVPQFEIVSWAHNCLRPWRNSGNGDVRVWYLQTASANVVRRSAMGRLRDVYLQALTKRRPFDTFMTSIREDVQWYAMKPALSRQKPCFSDILGKRVDYGC